MVYFKKKNILANSIMFVRSREN